MKLDEKRKLKINNNLLEKIVDFLQNLLNIELH